MTQTDGHHLAAVQVRNQALDAVEADLVGWCERPPFDGQVARLAAYRGVTRLGALRLAAEVGDWRRIVTANAFMRLVGWSQASLPAAARSTAAGSPGPATPTCGRSWWSRPGPTGTGRVLAASSPAASRALTPGSSRARGGAAAPGRPLGTLAARRHTKRIVAGAIARELAGFLWAEMTA
jgi:hypothetical protein